MCRAANARLPARIDWLRLALNGEVWQHNQLPPAVARIAESWRELPPHFHEAIATLVDAGMSSSKSRQGASGAAADTSIDALAWRLARQCREVVLACLREEEWPDADREFFNAIHAGLSAAMGRQDCSSA